MTDSATDALWGVILSLQAKIQNQHPGTRQFDIADHALTLSLSHRRARRNAAYLYRSVTRDARRILDRQKLPVAFGALPSAGEAPCETFFLPSSQTPTPLDAAVLNELDANIRAAVADIPGAAGCLDGLLAGEQITDTARRLKIADHQVNYLRRRIREATTGILAREAA